MPKLVKLASFWKTKVCGQTMLPDRSVWMNQELLENAKIHKFKCDILSDFKTLWACLHILTMNLITNSVNDNSFIVPLWFPTLSLKRCSKASILKITTSFFTVSVRKWIECSSLERWSLCPEKTKACLALSQPLDGWRGKVLSGGGFPYVRRWPEDNSHPWKMPSLLSS